ncbi:hypothetical protein GTQ43_39050 [Nostoc sp. KVJ3]|uniref:hypothetical protein n=1 Tax=Nostoc sp. KVJ3 TaxID=457945 RepID=UPI0022373718|nr:hypothetical protein [Nostoc sp. KVJ3]MCW5319355.1 hypothetical protein [Nostoc sp. KVJ3]
MIRDPRQPLDDEPSDDEDTISLGRFGTSKSFGQKPKRRKGKLNDEYFQSLSPQEQEEFINLYDSLIDPDKNEG